MLGALMITITMIGLIFGTKLWHDYCVRHGIEEPKPTIAYDVFMATHGLHRKK